MPDSWRLKLDRAEKHLSELRIGIGEYVQKRPYEAVQVVGGGNCRKHAGYDCGGSWTLHITEQPDPQLAVILGDALFDIRSALDHLAVALAPPGRRRQARFPIEAKNIWAKEGRRYVVRDPKARKSWRTTVEGMAPEAVAFIESLQPYRKATPEKDTLFTLNRLENADKHRQLTLFAPGLQRAHYWGSARGRTIELTVERPDAFVVEDGAEIAHFGGRGGPPLQYDEVQVQVSGALLVTTKIADPNVRRGQRGEYAPIGALVETLIASARDLIFPGLEPYTWARLHPPAP